MAGKRRVLIIGGGFAGLCAARDLKSKFNVTIVDAKSYFEYTPGVLRAYVKPAHLDALTFELQPVLQKMGVGWIWGEVLKLDGDNMRAEVKPMFSEETEQVEFDFCIIASGCNFNFLHKWGESLWFPTVHQQARLEGSWPHIDERYLEGRRRHVFEEYNKLKALNEKKASVLVAGAGFIGVEWATELNHYFPNLDVTIIDFLPNCLGPLPAKAAEYCDKYMKKVGIKCFYGIGYEPNNPDFWKKIDMANGADITYICMGVKASNYFMPADTLSDKGPGGGKWIHMSQALEVTTKDDKVWGQTFKGGEGKIYAVGDCNYACVPEAGKAPGDWPVPPIPKISYPGEEQAVIAVANIKKLDAKYNEGRKNFGLWGGCCCLGEGKGIKISDSHWPWGAGMFATSLGPHDACFVAGANWNKGSGYMVTWGAPSAVQKEIIEASKVDECKGGIIGMCIWHFVHHTPVHLWGKGPLFGY